MPRSLANPHSPPAVQPTAAATKPAAVLTVVGEGVTAGDDVVAVEAPLAIHLELWREGRWGQVSLAVAMRTPGDDEALVAGFLLTEGIVCHPDQVLAMTPDVTADEAHVLRVRLRPDVEVALPRWERHSYRSSSCGVCGKASIEAVRALADPVYLKGAPIVTAATIGRLPEAVRGAQGGFAQTGGLHAAALFDETGRLLDLREDVGRHNALDKLIGAAWLSGGLPWSRQLVLLSGRTSFELVQKGLVASVPILAAIGAPSSLAVDLADEFDMTLLGFVSQDRFNIYSGSWRIPEAADRGWAGTP